MADSENKTRKRGRPPSARAAGADGAGAGGAGAGGAGAGGAKKPRAISPAFGVNDRILYAIYGETDETSDDIVAYALASIEKIVINSKGCLYTIRIDRDQSVRDDVEESELTQNVQV